METLDLNKSYEEKCGMYTAVKSELIIPKPGSGKKEYIRFSLKKIKKNGRIDALDFSHYFNVGIPELVSEYKRLGVTEKGISKEALEAAKKAYEDGETEVEFQFYGFWWTQSFGGVYRNKETNTVADSTLVFIPCDEDTSQPKSAFAMTQARLQDILKGYERVVTSNDTATPTDDSQQTPTDADLQAEFAKFMAAKNAAQ